MNSVKTPERTQPADHADHERDQEGQQVAALVEQRTEAYQRGDAGQETAWNPLRVAAATAAIAGSSLFSRRSVL